MNHESVHNALNDSTEFSVCLFVLSLGHLRNHVSATLNTTDITLFTSALTLICLIMRENC